MANEPALSFVSKATTLNPYEKRWRWWYSAIADWMIRNPGRPLKECALELKKADNTIYAIVSTDLFKDYLAKRKAEWSRDHDEVLRSKLTNVAELALDAVSDKLTKQRDKIDLPLLTTLLESSLDRLGFAPQTGPALQFNQFTQDNSTRVVQLPGSVTALALEEARFALRAAQSQYLLPPQSVLGAGKGAEPLLDSSPVVEPEEESDVDSSASS